MTLHLHFPDLHRTANVQAGRNNQRKPSEREAVGVMQFQCICGAPVLPDPRERRDVQRLCCNCRARRIELIMAQRRRAA